MKHCIITPTKFINDPLIWKQSDFLLVLSHLLDNDCSNEYAQEVEKFRKSWKKLYLDNWLFENWSPESPVSLLRKAEKIQATYVFAPDHLYDREQTQEAAIVFEAIRKALSINVQLAYVVQAKSPFEYISAYKWAEEQSWIKLIWLSILSIPKSFGWEITEARIECIDVLNRILRPRKDAHLLWLWWSLKDLEFAEQFHWIKSNDSCSAYMTGFKELEYNSSLEVPGWKVEEKVTFDSSVNLSEKQLRSIVTNIRTIKTVIENV